MTTQIDAPTLQEIMVWPHSPDMRWLGSWATTRYPDYAIAYVPRVDFERVKNAAVLGLQMAEVNDLRNTAETIRKTLAGSADAVAAQLKAADELLPVFGRLKESLRKAAFDSEQGHELLEIIWGAIVDDAITAYHATKETKENE